MVKVNRRPIKVAISHEEPLLAMGLRVALQNVPSIALVEADAHSGFASARVLVTDWAGGMRWVHSDSVAREVPLSVLVVSSHAREQPMVSALRRGLAGVMLCSSTPEELVHAIEAVGAGRSYVCVELAQRVAANFSREPLTCREDTVLQLLARGQCNKAIASNLGIAPGTVKSHVKAILGKLAASSRTEAAHIATEMGIVEVSPSARLATASLN